MTSCLISEFHSYSINKKYGRGKITECPASPCLLPLGLAAARLKDIDIDNALSHCICYQGHQNDLSAVLLLAVAVPEPCIVSISGFGWIYHKAHFSLAL